MDLSDWRIWWKRQGAPELRALLMKEWDPAHTAEDPELADEYDSYMLPLARKLREGATPQDITAYLDAIEVEAMGYEPMQRNAALGERIFRWYVDSTGNFAKPP